jgi:hypothetical protein
VGVPVDKLLSEIGRMCSVDLHPFIHPTAPFCGPFVTWKETQDTYYEGGQRRKARFQLAEQNKILLALSRKTACIISIFG